MDGIENIKEVLRLFETSLHAHEPIVTVTELAARTGYSTFHFARLFSSVIGMNPKEYLMGRLLTHMLDELIDTPLTLSAFALDYGFHDYASFSRAFRKRFGTSPRNARDRRFIPYGRLDPIVPSVHLGREAPISPPKVMELSSFTLCGLSFFIPDNTVSFHSQWNTFMRAESHISGRLEEDGFHQLSSWLEETPLHGLSVLCAVAVDDHVEQKPVFVTKQVPGGSYLRFVHTGDLAGLGETYRYLYGTWFASHAMKPRGSWEFQRYPEGGDTVEIYIPISR